MRKWLRRIRGALGMGFTWAAAWAVVGVLPRWVFGADSDLPFPILFGGLGLIAGVTVSGVLVLTEGRRTLDQMSLPRFATWGAIGGLALSALFVRGTPIGTGAALAIHTTLALACAACAAGSLALARGAARQELPDIRGDGADAELADHELQELPGGDDDHRPSAPVRDTEGVAHPGVRGAPRDG